MVLHDFARADNCALGLGPRIGERVPSGLAVECTSFWRCDVTPRVQTITRSSSGLRIGGNLLVSKRVIWCCGLATRIRAITRFEFELRLWGGLPRELGAERASFRAVTRSGKLRASIWAAEKGGSPS